MVSSTWRREDELSGLKTELSALDRKILLSLTPVDEGEDKPDEKQKQDTGQAKYATNANSNSIPVPNRLNEYREAMGDRLVIGSVPKPDSENRPAKGFKL